MDAHFKFLSMSAAFSHSMLPIRNQQGYQLGPYHSVEHTMATYHLSIKSSKKGNAATHANYIARQGRFAKDLEEADLVEQGHGNLPTWANDDPLLFWRQADKHERANAAVYRELEVSLPNELSTSQHMEMISSFVEQHIGGKPYQFAIHEPLSSLAGISQPHAHIMVCDRMPDGIERSPEQFFKRFNPTNPESGGCKKLNGACSLTELKHNTQSIRKLWADINNAALEQAGIEERVDHRSHKDRGIERQPERHRGRLGILRMSEGDKAQLLHNRTLHSTSS